MGIGARAQRCSTGTFCRRNFVIDHHNVASYLDNLPTANQLCTARLATFLDALAHIKVQKMVFVTRTATALPAAR
jgi:hypothetical protein